MDWVIEYINQSIQTVDSITALSGEWEKRTESPYTRGKKRGIQTIIKQLHLFGGVDLTVEPNFISDNGQARSLQMKVLSALREKETGPVFNITHEGKSLRAVLLPITKNGQEMWKTLSTIDKNNITYQFNNEGIIIKSIDNLGNISEYSYDANQELKAINIKATNGLVASAKKDNQCTLWTITNPKGNIIQYRYGLSDHLNEIEVDGKKVATYNYNAEGRITNIHYPGYKEKFSYDNNGYIKEYEVLRLSNDVQSVSEVERISFAYDNLGNITKISGPLVDHIDIVYSEDKLPNSIRTPQEEINYTYDSQKRIKEIDFLTGISARYSYDGEELIKIEIKNGNNRAEYLFNEGQIVSDHNLLGGIMKYGYNEDGLLNSLTDPNGNKAKYIYGKQNRLQEIHFPDGQWIEYRYRKTESKRHQRTQQQSITVIFHSSSAPLRKKSKGTAYIK
jgi:YD repeat-containing protein